MDMTLDLASVDAKLSHSTNHFNSIQNIVRPWINSDLYGLTQKANTEFTRHSLVYWCSKELDLIELSLRFGDAVHNLRSALDNFIYSLGNRVAAQRHLADWDAVAKTIAFPITDCSARFGSFYRRKLEPVFAGHLFDVLESFQPYIRQHPISPPYLKLLRDLDDSDKHRLLRLAFVQGTKWELNGSFGIVPFGE